MPYSLKIVSSPSADKMGMKFTLAEGETLIGRISPPCQIQLDGAKVSKKHCVIRVVGGEVNVEDLNSSNGLFVNGKQVSKAPLKDRDKLVIGDYVVEFTVK